MSAYHDPWAGTELNTACGREACRGRHLVFLETLSCLGQRCNDACLVDAVGRIERILAHGDVRHQLWRHRRQRRWVDRRDVDERLTDADDVVDGHQVWAEDGGSVFQQDEGGVGAQVDPDAHQGWRLWRDADVYEVL